MEWLRLALRYVHLVGFAALLGGAIAQYVSGRIRINTVMLAGAATQVVTGVILAAPFGRDEDDAFSSAKLAVKGVIAVLIFAMVFFSRKRESVNPGHFMAIIGLTLVNAGVAVFWH